MITVHEDIRDINKEILTVQDVEHIYNKRGFYVVCENGKIIDFIKED